VSAALPPLESWLPAAELGGVASSSYWNDRAIERGKELWADSPEDRRALRYLREETRLERAFRDLLGRARALGYVPGGVVLDLGAGICWTSAILARERGVARVLAVDFSRHRLAEIAPHMVAQYGAPAEKIQRVVGSFYDLRVEPGSVDAVVLFAAFHHAFEVERLLAEVRRVLRPSGWLLISGEQPVTARDHARRLAGELLRAARTRRLPRLSFPAIFPPDPVLGDHYYRVSDYVRLLERHGFAAAVQRLPYALTGDPARACNFICRKTPSRDRSPRGTRGAPGPGRGRGC
jgi:SAM-dependent methyltransferase